MSANTSAPGATQAMTYDDKARTKTMVNSNKGVVAVGTTTTTTTVTKSEKVCR